MVGGDGVEVHHAEEALPGGRGVVRRGGLLLPPPRQVGEHLGGGLYLIPPTTWVAKLTIISIIRLTEGGEVI